MSAREVAGVAARLSVGCGVREAALLRLARLGAKVRSHALALRSHCGRMLTQVRLKLSPRPLGRGALALRRGVRALAL